MKEQSSNNTNYKAFINLLSEIVMKSKTTEDNKKQLEGGNKYANYTKQS
ncbi:hypothetical protein [Clostridium sp.]